MIDSSSYEILQNTNFSRRKKYSLLTKLSPSNAFLRETSSNGNLLLDTSISDEVQKIIKYKNAVVKSFFSWPRV